MPVTLNLPQRFTAREDHEELKTQGEIEAAICEGMSCLEQANVGRGPKRTTTNLIGDLLVVRLQDVLTSAEKYLVTTLPDVKGRELLKQVRSQLIELARPTLESLVREITGVELRSLHHDISTRTGEEIVVFTLSRAPSIRETKKKQTDQAGTSIWALS